MCEEPHCIIKVFGIGGAGINAINQMNASGLRGVTLISADTDKQTLSVAQCSQTIQLGVSRTQGYGCGGNAHTGSEAAVESIDAIKAVLDGADLVFIVAGMGGGVGSGAAPVIARTAKELGALTIGVVTKPFHFEGKKRLVASEMSIQALLDTVDVLIIIPCNGLVQLAPKKATVVDMLKSADEALHRAVRGISDILVCQHVDFTDVRAIFEGKGKAAAVGFGAASGELRARDAAIQAMSSPLFKSVPLADADGVWLNITGNEDTTLEEISTVVDAVHEQTHGDAIIFLGTRFDDSVGDELRVTVIASGTPISDNDIFGADANSATPEDDCYYFDGDGLYIMPDWIGNAVDELPMSDFIWEKKCGLSYRIHVEPPRIYVEQTVSEEDKKQSAPCKILRYNMAKDV